MKIIFVGITLVVFACVYMIRQGGYNPKPILVMKASEYESQAKLGQSLFKRFFLEAKEIQKFVVVCNLADCKNNVIWSSFLGEANKSELPSRAYFNLVGSQENKDAKINSALTSNERSLIVTDSLADWQNMITGPEIILFFMTPFYVDATQEPKQTTCKYKNNLTNIDCLTLGYSRRFYRKNFDVSKTHVGMEKISNNKYLLYLN